MKNETSIFYLGMAIIAFVWVIAAILRFMFSVSAIYTFVAYLSLIVAVTGFVYTVNLIKTV